MSFGAKPPPADDSAETVLETVRLRLRRIVLADAPFILNLLNQPSFLRFIGDKGVRNLEDASNYIRTGPMESYARFGFGLYLAELKQTGLPAGMCGLLKRDSLPDADLGFAFLPDFWSRGYAFEAASAVLGHGRDDFDLRRILAITHPENAASIRLLEKLGLSFERMIQLSGDAEPIMLFAWTS